MKTLFNPRTVLIIVFALLCNTCAKEEIDVFGSISGTVRDEQQQPIEGISVSLTPGGVTKSTGKDGSYSFIELESKQYTLTFAKNEYITDSKEATVQAGVNTTLDVTLKKEQIIPILAVSAQSLDFGTDKTTLSLDVSNTGKGVLDWTIKHAPGWFICSPMTGTTSTERSSITVTVNRSQKEKGSHSESFSITSNGGSKDIKVNMTVSGASLSLAPNTLDFGAITTEQQLTLTNTGATAIDYTAEASHNWIILQKTEGKLTSTDYLNVMVNRETLSPNDYTGSITIHAGTEDFVVPVKMTVPANNKPSVSMEPPRNITATQATFKGAILSVGKDRITAHGFCWSVSPNPTINNSKTNLGDCTAPKTFESTATDLQEGTTYYVKAYAQNSVGIAYTNEQTFTTVSTSTQPEVSTGAVSDVTASTAKVGGTVSDLGHSAGVTKHGHLWSVSPNPTLSTTLSGTNFGALQQAGSYTSDLADLTPNKTYYVRAYATNARGTAYGEVRSFTTQNVDPQISVSPTSLSFVATSPSPQTVNVSVAGTNNWTVSANVTWLSFSTPSGTGTGSFDVTAASSTTTTQRTGTITVASGTETKSISVTQDAYNGIGGTTGPLTWSLDGGVLTISGTGAIPDCGWGGTAEPWLAVRDNITTVYIQNGVTSIGEWAFSDCSSLTSITIPNSVTTIGDYAFYYCTSLTSITIPNSVTTIGESFSGCSLTSITIPNSVTTIGGFGGCLSLTSVTIGNSVKTIRDYAFSGCSNLTAIDIPNSVTTIGDNAFSGCESLTSVTIGNSVTTIGNYAFNGCSSLTAITIPNSVTTIRGYAFSGCSLTSITIPNSVTTIGERAFSGCSSLTSITIGNLVTTIGNYAFNGCSSLRNVTVLRPIPPTAGYSAFNNVPLKSATLTVPSGCKAAYQSKDGWKQFGTIIELEN